MNSNKISKMKMSEIIENYGLPMAFLYYIDDKGRTQQMLRSTYKPDALGERLKEFESKIKEVQIKSINSPLEINGIVSVMNEYEDIIDKEQYIFLMAKLLKEDVEGELQLINGQKRFNEVVYQTYLPKHLKGNYSLKQALTSAKVLLSDVDIMFGEIDSSSKKPKFESSQEFVGNKKAIMRAKENSLKKLEEIENTVGLENLLKRLEPYHMITFFKYQNVATTLMSYLYFKYPDNIKIFENKELVEYDTENDVVKPHYEFEDFLNLTKEYFEYVNVDKLLLLSVFSYYAKTKNQNRDFTIEEFNELKDLLDKIGKLVDNNKRKVEFIVSNNDDRNDNKNTVYKISYDDIVSLVEDMSKHFINGIFYDDKKLRNLFDNIISGNISIDSIAPNDFKKTVKDVTVRDILLLLENQPNGLQYIIESNILSEKNIYMILDKKKDFDAEQISFLINKNILDINDILKLYMQDKVSLENVKLLKENLKERNVESIVSESKLVELYLDPSKKEEFDKYRRIFKTLKIDETADEIKQIKDNNDNEDKIKEIEKSILQRQKDIGEKILGQSANLLESDKMYELYHMGLLQIDTIIDYIGADAVKDLYASGKLKPIDAKRLYDDSILKIDMIRDVLKSNNLSDTEKLVLIYSTFPSTEDKNDVEIRESLIKYIRNPDDTNNFNKKRKIKQKDHDINPIIDDRIKKYASDPCARWNLISSLDKQYSEEYLKDGNIIFYLPNEGKYIIEKLYTKDYKAAYGAATYILDEDLFNKNKEDIIVSKKVNRSYLVGLEKIQRGKEIKKIVHTGWGNAIIKYFDIDKSDKYSEKEKKKIRELAEKVEKSKKRLGKSLDDEDDSNVK